MAAHACMFIVLFTILASLFRSGSATSILVPLYAYPGTSAVNWNPLFRALSAHPRVTFEIIIDPDSGPGAGTYPDSNYIAGISKLHGYRNAILIGYVHTLYAKAPLSTVDANVTKYAKWAGYPGGVVISVRGIFFDEAPSDDSSASVRYMASAAAFARKAIRGAYIVYNPGTPTSNAYFSPVPPNLSVQFENYPAQWMNRKTVANFAPGEVRRSAVLLHDEATSAEAQKIARQCVADGVGAFYATPDCCYASLNYVSAVATALDW